MRLRARLPAMFFVACLVPKAVKEVARTLRLEALFFNGSSLIGLTGRRPRGASMAGTFRGPRRRSGPSCTGCSIHAPPAVPRCARGLPHSQHPTLQSPASGPTSGGAFFG